MLSKAFLSLFLSLFLMNKRETAALFFEKICQAHIVKFNGWVFETLENNVICVITATKDDSLASISFWSPEKSNWNKSNKNKNKHKYSHGKTLIRL